MMRIFKSVLFVVLVVPLGLGAMESQPHKIELGMQLVAAASNASRELDWNKVEQLINQQADLNQQDAYGWTALMCAAVEGRQEIVRLLIDKQADLNLQDRDGETAFMMAIRDDRQTIAQLLINAHAALNLQNKAGRTALMFAVLPGRQEIATALIDAGADLTLQNDRDRTALMIAANNNHLSICHLIIETMIKKNKEQKERIHAFLTCLKRVPRFTGNLPRCLFKPILLRTLIDVRQEINRIKGIEIRNQLLEKYGLQPISNSEAQ